MHTFLQRLMLPLFITLLATSCARGSTPSVESSSPQIGIESRCTDPRGDIELIGEYSWDYVNQIADLASVAIATGPFDANSDQPILLVGVEMFVQSNPVAELSLADGDPPRQSVAVNISPASPIDDLLYYIIKFDQTTTQPELTVTRVSPDASPTIYSSTANFENGMFSAGVPLEVLTGIGVGSKWDAITFGSLLVDVALAMASDVCDGKL